MNTNMFTGRVIDFVRLPFSINGNPRYMVTVEDVPYNQHYQTKSDASVNYDVENLVRERALVRITLTRAGRIETMERV